MTNILVRFKIIRIISHDCYLCGYLKKMDPATFDDAYDDDQCQLKKREPVCAHDYGLNKFGVAFNGSIIMYLLVSKRWVVQL